MFWEANLQKHFFCSFYGLLAGVELYVVLVKNFQFPSLTQRSLYNSSIAWLGCQLACLESRIQLVKRHIFCVIPANLIFPFAVLKYALSLSSISCSLARLTRTNSLFSIQFYLSITKTFEYSQRGIRNIKSNTN